MTSTPVSSPSSPAGAVPAGSIACTSPAFGKPGGDWQRDFLQSRFAPLDAGLGMAGLAAQLGLLAIGRMDLASLGINGVLLVLIPVLVTELCALRVERAQPRNLFVYIFFSGFFPAALAVLLCILVGLGVLWVDGLFPMPPWLGDFVGYLWMVIFPEAFINGMIVTALVVFYPDWLETFNRSRYLAAPWKDDNQPH